MKSNLFLCVLILSFLSIFISGCPPSGGGGGGGDDGNECDGPVPCLTTHWNGVDYLFREGNGNIILVLSTGNAFAGAGITDEGDLISLGGPPTNCHNGNLTTGGLDYNRDGTIDYWFFSVSGNVNICDRTFRITNLVLDGDPEENVVASYIGQASVNNVSDGILSEILFETMDKLREEYLE